MSAVLKQFRRSRCTANPFQREKSHPSVGGLHGLPRVIVGFAAWVTFSKPCRVPQFPLTRFRCWGDSESGVLKRCDGEGMDRSMTPTKIFELRTDRTVCHRQKSRRPAHSYLGAKTHAGYPA